MSGAESLGPAEAERRWLREALSARGPARGELVRRLLPVVRARVRRRVGPGVEIDDFVQEVWLSLFDKGGKRLLAYEPSRGASLEGYVGHLAERQVLQILRARSALKRGGHLRAVELSGEGEGSPATRSPAEQVDTADLVDKLGQHLGQSLPERGRLVLQLVFQDGLGASEAADAMGVQVQVIYNWQHKIRASARNFLEQQEATPPLALQTPRFS